MGDLLQPWHLIVLAVVAFLLFGAKRLPELGKGLGEGLKGFREGIKGVSDPAPPPVQRGGRGDLWGWAAAAVAHTMPSSIQKCRQWSVSMIKLSPTVPSNAEKIAM